MNTHLTPVASANSPLPATTRLPSPAMVTSRLQSADRLMDLEKSRLMDSDQEAQFDRITRLITQLLHVDVALVSLVDSERQFFKSQCGLPPPVSEARGTPLSHSFCQYVVASEEALIVPDATHHDVLKDNGAVADINVIGYLGVPIRSPDHHVIGSLCAIHGSPRDWTAGEKAALEDFARIVEDALRIRQFSNQALAEAAKNDVLAKEYNHRVKNTMAIAASLVRLSRREATTIDAFEQTLQSRFASLTEAHDLLAYTGNDLPLETLLKRLLKPYFATRSSVRFEGPPIVIGKTKIIPICLIVHELATNAAKYGALSNDAPLVITWEQNGDTVALQWQEQTARLQKHVHDDNNGFGSKLLAVAARQLDGKLTSDWHGDTLTHALYFPNNMTA